MFATDQEHNPPDAQQSGPPGAPRWTMTPTAERIFGVLDRVRELGYMVAVAGAPGTGKTTAARQYQSRYGSSVVYLECCRGMAKLGDMLTALCDLVGTDPHYRRTRHRAIARALAARKPASLLAEAAMGGAVLIVDEAQYLALDALEEVESITKLAGVGLVLLGNPNTLRRKRMTSGSPIRNAEQWKADFDRFVSRCAFRVALDAPEDEDVIAVAKAWGVDESDERALATLLEISANPTAGGLRGVYFTLLHAERLAAESHTPLSDDLILQAWRESGKADRRVWE